MIDTTYMTAEEILNLQVKTPCDFCQTKTPEPILDDNYIDGHRLCNDCHDEYCLQVDEDNENNLNPINMKGFTITLRKFHEKKQIEPKVWTKSVCLYCGKDLGKDRVNSANYFWSIHNKCASKLGRNRVGLCLKEL